MLIISYKASLSLNEKVFFLKNQKDMRKYLEVEYMFDSILLI